MRSHITNRGTTTNPRSTPLSSRGPPEMLSRLGPRPRTPDSGVWGHHYSTPHRTPAVKLDLTTHCGAAKDAGDKPLAMSSLRDLGRGPSNRREHTGQ
jgi:hypothetical protein